MDWSDTFRDRYYGSGYVYIAGSLAHRVLKILSDYVEEIGTIQVVQQTLLLSAEGAQIKLR